MQPQAASGIGASVALCLPILRNRWYELFLRTHQCLAAVSVYGIFIHLAPRPLRSRIPVYALLGVAGISSLVLGVVTIYRNRVMRSRSTRAVILHEGGAVLVKVDLSRGVLVEAGQHVSLWLFVPSKRFRSILEHHPFVVTNWSDGPLDTLELLVEPRSGLTRDLGKLSNKGQHHCRALFSGPHGSSVPVGNYEVVLMVATGYGIAAQLPYLKCLLHNYNSHKARCRRIHLVWVLDTLGTSYGSRARLYLTSRPRHDNPAHAEQCIERRHPRRERGQGMYVPTYSASASDAWERSSRYLST